MRSTTFQIQNLKQEHEEILAEMKAENEGLKKQIENERRLRVDLQYEYEKLLQKHQSDDFLAELIAERFSSPG